MSIFSFESLAVITKFQAKFFRLVAQSRFKVARVGVLERIGQRFLPDVEKIFLPGLGKLRQFSLRLKLCVKRRPGGRVLNNTFERLPKILFLQCLRTQRVHGAAGFAQTPPR